MDYCTSVKPEVYAVAKNIAALDVSSAGTSFAAPHVTGLIAQLIESRPSLATNPQLIKALVMVGGHDFDSSNGYYDSTGPTDIYNAGMIDAKNSLISESNGYFVVGTISGSSSSSSSTYSKTINVSSNWNYLRIALVWSKRNTLSGDHNTSNNIQGSSLTNLNMSLYDPNGNLVATSATSNCSYEFIHFPIVQSGTYRVVITKSSSVIATDTFALAWR